MSNEVLIALTVGFVVFAIQTIGYVFLSIAIFRSFVKSLLENDMTKAEEEFNKADNYLDRVKENSVFGVVCLVIIMIFNFTNLYGFILPDEAVVIILILMTIQVSLGFIGYFYGESFARKLRLVKK